MGVLGRFVKNKRYPEASIAEGIISMEATNFCARYVPELSVGLDLGKRNDDNLSSITPNFKISVFNCK
jgi:hypothetical protein